MLLRCSCTELNRLIKMIKRIANPVNIANLSAAPMVEIIPLSIVRSKIKTWVTLKCS